MSVFRFFDLPQELQDLIHETACSDKPLAREGKKLKAAYRGFMGNKKLWTDYKRAFLARAVVHHRLSTLWGARPGPADKLPAVMPATESDNIVLLIDVILPQQTTASGRDFFIHLYVPRVTWPEIMDRVGQYTNASSIAVEISLRREDDTEVDRGDKFMWVWGDIIERLDDLLDKELCVNGNPLKQVFVRLDGEFAFWWEGPGTQPMSVGEEGDLDFHYVADYWRATTIGINQGRGLGDFLSMNALPLCGMGNDGTYDGQV